MSTFTCAFLLVLGTLCATPLLAVSTWVESAQNEDSEFPIHNLPYGVFSTTNDPAPRVGVAIGNEVLDLRACAEEGLIAVDSEIMHALRQPTLNAFMALGPAAWHAVRGELLALLDVKNTSLRDDAVLRERLLLSQSSVSMHLPARIGDYTDFYTCREHAYNCGKVFRPENPLVPAFRHLPMAYHGRASSVVISGTDVIRPWGQVKPPEQEPVHIPTGRLDYEMEMGVFVGTGNAQGAPIAIEDAREHLFGLVILNDWSARDIQKWEIAPLGPFNSKNFATSISPWIVTLDALEPYRVVGPPRQEGDPDTLSYLVGGESMAFDVTVEVFLRSETMREQGLEPVQISRSNLKNLYWTIAQMLTQHSVAGCNLQPGDLFGSGTISGEPQETRGCLLEHSLPGMQKNQLPDGSVRGFLQDGDEVIMRAYAQKEGLPKIGFGECRGIVLPAVERTQNRQQAAVSGAKEF